MKTLIEKLKETLENDKQEIQEKCQKNPEFSNVKQYLKRALNIPH